MPSYAFEGPKWNKPIVTYSFQASNDGSFTGILDGTYQSLVRQALATWSSVSGITFMQARDATSGAGGPDIRIGFAQFTASTIGMTTYSYRNGASGSVFVPGVTVQLEDPAALPVISTADGLTWSGTATTVLQVATHEIGHSLGLAHSSDPTSIMYPSAGAANRALNTADITGIDTLYPVPPAPAVLPFTGLNVSVAHRLGDYNGDGTADLVWRSVGGQLVEWQIGGATIVGTATIAGDGTWTVAGTADFGGDGKTDLLWQSGSSLSEWQMNGLGATGTAALLDSVRWSAVGTADLDGDGKSDVMLQDASGQVVEARMDGLTPVSTASIGGDTNWRFLAAADFNGDGKSDILWRDRSGNVALWTMNGADHVGSALLGGGAGWAVAGIGDFDGDGRADLLWQGASGQVVEWLMNGSSAVTATALGGNADWQVAGTGDLNGDGKSDILWRGPDGGVVAWTMDGSKQTGAVALGGDSTWSLL